MCRFWSSNRSGHCLADTCQNVRGDLEHLLITCPALEHSRHRLHSLWCLKTVDCPPLHRLILRMLGSTPETQVRFILDSTAFPEVIGLMQLYGQEIQDRILYLTRTWAFTLHRQKMKILGRWPDSQSRLSHPNPSSAPSPTNTLPVTHDTPLNDSPNITLNNTSDTQLTNDNSDKGSWALYGLMSSDNDLINTLPVTGSTNAFLPSTTTPTTTNITTQTHATNSLVLAEPTAVHYAQPSDSMPEPTCFKTCSNLSPSVDCVVELCKNLAGHGEGHGVTGCSHSIVTGHQLPESANLSILPSPNLS